MCVCVCVCVLCMYYNSTYTIIIVLMYPVNTIYFLKTSTTIMIKVDNNVMSRGVGR